MKAGIISPDLDSEFYTSEKCHIVELSNSPDDPQVSIARVRVEPVFFKGAFGTMVSGTCVNY